MRNILAMAVLSAALASASFAYAQTTSSTRDNQGSVDHHMDNAGGSGGEDAANYMTGPGVHLFYTDEAMTTLRPIGEIRTVYTEMGPQERLELTRQCASNEDTRFADLYSAIGTF